MKLLLDMNISPALCNKLTDAGWDAIHWSSVGNPVAADSEIMEYAVTHGYVVFTHDLDFTAMLAATHGTAPSILQIRAQDVLSESFFAMLMKALDQFGDVLEQGALVVVESFRARARVLPLK